jgi:hypothetical protein
MIRRRHPARIVSRIRGNAWFLAVQITEELMRGILGDALPAVGFGVIGEGIG